MFAAVWEQIEPEREGGDHEQAGDRNRDPFTSKQEKCQQGERNDSVGMCVVHERRHRGKHTGKKNPACAGCLVARDALCSFCAAFCSWRPLIKCKALRLPACSRSRFRSSPAVLSLSFGWRPPDQPPFIGWTSTE